MEKASTGEPFTGVKVEHASTAEGVKHKKGKQTKGK
jgi:hypothetical protein